jgi:galactose mutarotase-like enzyme
MIPTGEIVDIRGTALDFTSPHAIGERIDSDHPQLKFASGYDFNYVINKEPGELAFAASAFEPESGRYMEVFTTEPGVQLYTGNHLTRLVQDFAWKPSIFPTVRINPIFLQHCFNQMTCTTQPPSINFR